MHEIYCSTCQQQQRLRNHRRHMVNGICNTCYLRQRKRKRDPVEVVPTVIPSKQRRTNLLTLIRPSRSAMSLSTRQRRSRLNLLEQCLQRIAAPPSYPKHLVRQSKIALLTAWIKRHRRMFEEAMTQAGLIRFCGRLSARDGIELKAKSGLPWTMLRFLHHFYLSKGINIMPNEKEMRHLIKSLGIMYESGHTTINNKLNKPYIHILEFWSMIKHLSIKRHAAGLLLWWPHQRQNQLSFVISIDKGGHYTKIQLIWLNHKYPQTEDAALMLGMYEGKESYEGIAKVFGPLMKSFAHPPSQWSIISTCKLKECVDQLPTLYYSGKCNECMKDHKPTLPLILRNITINSCHFMYGGDYLSIGRYSGIGGPSSTHPCLCCEQTKEELHIGSGIMRTLASLNHYHSNYDKHGDKAADHMNVINETLIHTEIVNNIVPLPLHIIIGLTNKLYKCLELQCQAWDKHYKKSLYHKRWVEVTKSMDVRIAKQHGGKLTGDACYRFISQQEKLSLIMSLDGKMNDDDETWCVQYMWLIQDLCDIHHHIMRPTPLCSHEINHICEKAAHYIIKWMDMFGRVTPKLHLLAFHLPLFVQNHYSVGMMSEQSLERQHKIFNRLDTLYRTIGDNECRLRALIQQSHLQACYDVITFTPQ